MTALALLLSTSTWLATPAARLELDDGPLLVGIPIIARVTIDDLPGRSVELPRAGLDVGEFVVLDATTLRDGAAVVARVTLIPTISGEQILAAIPFVVESSDGDRLVVSTEPRQVFVQSALARDEPPTLRDELELERFDDASAADRRVAWWAIPGFAMIVLGIAWGIRRRIHDTRVRPRPRLERLEPPEAIAIRALETLGREHTGDARKFLEDAGEVMRTYLESRHRERIRPRTAAELAQAFAEGTGEEARPMIELMFAAEDARYSSRDVGREDADGSVTEATRWLRSRLDRHAGASR